MAEYIDRTAFLTHMKKTDRYFAVKFDIEAFPAADVVEVVHGRWIALGQRTYGGGRSYTHYCSVCGQHGFDDYKGCPNCSARMDGDGNG